MIKYKSATVFIFISAERFDRSSSTYKKNTNQLYFWTGHVQSIVNVKKKFEVQAATAK